MALPTIQRFDLSDIERQPQAIEVFTELGITTPAMIVHAGDIGNLAAFSAMDYDSESKTFPELSEADLVEYYLLKQRVVDYVTGSEGLGIHMGYKWSPGGEFIEGLETCTKKHVFKEFDRSPGAYELYDKGRHVDRRKRDKLAIYCTHLTTGGTGHVEVALASGDGIDTEYDRVVPTHFGDIMPGDFTVLPRGGGPRTFNGIIENITTVSHEFLSDTGGRSYIESQFALVSNS